MITALSLERWCLVVVSFVVCLSGFLCCVVLWCRVGSECLCKGPVFRVLETCIFLSSRYYRVWPRYYRFGRHGTTAPQHGTTTLVRYFGSTAPGGTTVSGHGTTAPSRARGGYDSGRGVPTPHTHSLVSLAMSLSLAQERRRRPSPDLHLRPISLDSDQWDRSPPLPLAMDQGFSPNPSFSWLFSCS